MIKYIDPLNFSQVAFFGVLVIKILMSYLVSVNLEVTAWKTYETFEGFRKHWVRNLILYGEKEINPQEEMYSLDKEG